jgi:hypothetical protein
MKTKLIYLMSIIFSLGVYNCDEADGGSYQSPPNPPNASTFTSIEDLRNSLKPDPHDYTVDPSGSFTVGGTDGTSITCTGNSILDSSGNIVSDEVNISLYEFNTLDEMILAKAPTTSNGSLLVTGGSFEVTAENATTGEELEFSSWGCQCSLNIQTNPSTTHESQMVLFKGNTDNLDNNDAEVVDWNQVNADGEGAGFAQGGNFQAWDIDVGFSNCDVLYNMVGENGTQFEATVSGVSDYTSNVEVWLIVDDFPSVVMLTTINITPALETYNSSIPTGLTGTLVGIHLDDDDNLNFGYLPITVAGDDSFNIDVDYGTEAELVALLESLVN